MNRDPALDELGELMSQKPSPWPPVDLDWDQEVRPISPIPEHPVFADAPDLTVPVDRVTSEHIREPEPVGHLRHRQSWEERHRQDVDDIRLAIGQAQMNLRDASDGCRAVNYHPEVREQINAALDRIMESLRLMDIHDPE